jgi:hypothetical protein
MGSCVETTQIQCCSNNNVTFPFSEIYELTFMEPSTLQNRYTLSGFTSYNLATSTQTAPPYTTGDELYRYVVWFWLGLWCLTPLSTIFRLYRGGQFYLWSKPDVPEEHHRLVASHWQTLTHNVVHFAPSVIRTHNISCDWHRLHR